MSALVNSKTCWGFVHGYALASCVTTPILQLMLGYVPLVYKLNFLLAISLSIYLMLHEELRYQQAFWVTKLVRHLFFRPKRFIQLQWWLLCWGFSGFPALVYEPEDDDCPGLAFTHWETFQHFCTISKSMAQYDMQWFLTMEEMRAELLAKRVTETNETTA